MSIKNQLRSAQRNNMGMSGKGRKKKLVALDRFTEKERNFCKTYNHKISKDIINFCITNHAGILQMENLSGFGNKEKSKEFILRNWSYFELQSMIKYKANLAGIKVVFIKPEYTSQMCPKCDAVDSKSRYDPKDKTKFKCTGCGYEIHADLNGAINIARSKNYVNEAIDETVDL
jgi:IS605 OrfB family transposase